MRHFGRRRIDASAGAIFPLLAATAATTAVASVLAVAGAVVALVALYQLALTVAAFFYRREEADRTPRSRLVVLVPAHDEEALIRRSVRSLTEQTYPRELYDVVVVADNCTDDTAAVAASAGATVLVRTEPEARGKGYALSWALERVLADGSPDAVVVVDADSVAVPEFLARLAAAYERGSPAVQGESLLEEEGSRAASLRAAAFLLVNRTRPAGRAVLGLACHLAGNGMLFARELLRAQPWDAFTSAEDVEYWIKLRRAGVAPAFAGGAILYSPTAPTSEAAAAQQLRWEGGKLHVARAQIPELLVAALRSRRPSLLDAAVELAVPPLGLLAAAALAGTIVAGVLFGADVVPFWSAVPWFVALAAIPLYVVLGLRAAHAPASAYRALAAAPALVATKLTRMHRLFTFRADSWVRTERDARDRTPR
jgi:cellulose synthase/poly-beta-1,6-N-acetylglucosamine synthase-like glycosyltransferase